MGFASSSFFWGYMLTQLPGAMLIQNVLLGSQWGDGDLRWELSVARLYGHLWGQGWAVAIFVETLQTSSAGTTCSWGNFGLIQCQNVRTWRVTLSESHHLTLWDSQSLPVALPIRPLGLVVPSLSWVWASPFSPWEPWAPHVCNTSAIRRPGSFDSQMDGYRFWIVFGFGIFSKIQEKSRPDQNLFGHSLK